ncbi:MAG: metallophosphoesterase [Bacteroidetes bacterium]|nr:MAG: metallophosphoesterase [Bacteroidota bacterium]
MRNTTFWWMLIGFMVLLDIYIFQVVRFLSHSANSKTKIIIYSAYWVLSAGAIIVLLLLPYFKFENQAKFIRTTIFAIIAGLFFAKLIAAVFFLLDDVRRAIQWVAGKIFFRGTEAEALQESDGISRSAFLSWAGIAMGGGLFGTLIYGFGNKYNYQLRKEQLAFKDLPASFKGLKIIQISDLHSGSFTDKASVQKGIDKILATQPDIILFTGDLVNNTAGEMDEYKDLFVHLKAPLGVYSVLGNHDYGDYVRPWPDHDDEHSKREEAAGKKLWTPLQYENLEKLKRVHAGMGWRLLMDEHVVIEKNGDKIAILGVQNWSAKGSFHRYGDLTKAYAGSEEHSFKILMSHDPSHWEAEVLKKYPDIHLMLSGHTHGMQFGVEIPGIKWSPVQYIYNQWAGLYEKDHQKLYVNRGFGFIGYPGRVGILPEITLIELV